MAVPAPGRRRVLFTLVFMGTGGIERSVCNVLAGLDRERFDPSLFFHHGPPPPDTRGRIPADVPISWGVGVEAYRRWELPRMLWRLFHEARKADIIVSGQEGRAALLARLAGALLGKPVLGMVHFDWGAFHREQPKRQLWGLKVLYPGMDRIVACGYDSAKAFAELVNVDRERLEVIPNFVDAERIRAAADAPLPAWAVPVFKKPVVIAVGRLEPQKSFDMLIRAHARMRAAGADTHLLILGVGSLEAELRALAAELGVASSVFMPGYADNPHALMRRATAFALSSRFEGLPMVMLEALALGCPIVSTDCPSGPAEALDGGRAGVLVPMGDDAAMAQALGRVVTDAKWRDGLRQRALDRADELSAERALKAWESLLAGV
ncbi:glycosyltransferase [Corallococcus interemptor]|uniref:glycosyltransferase n=1 Tax=Corallococcus TaxID=83461 RepID=UPI001CC09C41|nr:MULTISPECIES: glycosyltransferase [unclassified Corallococcus]MBZ4334412.1 glycosyltransferase [Corallococcus sp. AS-1-12]MBZ4372729.1 glycosyltransferase [Corallococcus sp. AS-1-6]